MILALLMALLGTAITADAVTISEPIVAGQWYTFGFGAAGTLAYDGASCCTLGVDSVFPGDPSWTYVAPAAGAIMRLTDGFNSGDSFTLLDSSTPIGSTPLAASGDGCDDDEEACFADPVMSHASIALAPGAHFFDIFVDVSPFGGGAAFFRIEEAQIEEAAPPTAVPVPAALVLLGVGLAGLVTCRSKRR
ncbi:MAG TPA: VPLPA-CTERM sorting domain-containing protein [Candidatus Limnocylindrales bacterium]|nr:VPLPA-CTERM sorting domain-containing protein [Candidatus Limnocylindrales bacterium]